MFMDILTRINDTMYEFMCSIHPQLRDNYDDDSDDDYTDNDSDDDYTDNDSDDTDRNDDIDTDRNDDIDTDRNDDIDTDRNDDIDIPSGHYSTGLCLII